MADGVIYYKKEDAEGIIQAFADLAEDADLSPEVTRLLDEFVRDDFSSSDSYTDADALDVLDSSFFSGLTQSSMYWKIWEALSATYDSNNPLTAATLKTDPDFTYLIQEFDLDPASLLINIPGYFIRNPEQFELVSDFVLSEESPVENPAAPVTSKENIQDKWWLKH